MKLTSSVPSKRSGEKKGEKKKKKRRGEERREEEKSQGEEEEGGGGVCVSGRRDLGGGRVREWDLGEYWFLASFPQI